MIVYKICLTKYSANLTASGIANRWNRKDEYVIYAGSSIALATLELVAHRSGIMAHKSYKLLTIEIDAAATIDAVKTDQLPKNWRSLNAYVKLQDIGSQWYQNNKSLLLQVPSAVVPQEFNYIINTGHPEFSSKIKILKANL